MFYSRNFQIQVSQPNKELLVCCIIKTSECQKKPVCLTENTPKIQVSGAAAAAASHVSMKNILYTARRANERYEDRARDIYFLEGMLITALTSLTDIRCAALFCASAIKSGLTRLVLTGSEPAEEGSRYFKCFCSIYSCNSSQEIRK